jgi:hypothetical protein
MDIGKKFIKKIHTEFNNTLKRSHAMIKLVSFHGCKDPSKYATQQT